MADSSRRIEDCVHRIHLETGDGQTARCGLLVQLTGVSDPSLCAVRRDACLACCRNFRPTEQELNPVVGSLLYGLALRIEAAGGTAGCSRERAAAISRLALAATSSEELTLDSRGGEPSAGSNKLSEVIPPPARRTGSPVNRWAVGVTTAPRQSPTLERCLTSLATTGWDNPRLFVDGDAPVPPAFGHLARTDRRPQLGAWPSYFMALAELLMREPDADAYMIVQDDALFAADFDVRAYLEQVLWPGKRPWTVSLFCARPYTQSQPGWHPLRGAWVWGALAFVFPREAAQRFLADINVVKHRWSRRRHALADIDWRVGKWAAMWRQPIYYPTPSLVQHIGEVSSLWPGARADHDRRASWLARRQSPASDA